MKLRQVSWSPVGGRFASRRPMLVRRAAYQPQVAYIRLADDAVVPTLDDIQRVIDALRGDQRVETLRTSALFPRSADRFAAAGFTAADTLRLLRADLHSSVVENAVERNRRQRARIATMRRWNYDAAGRIDRAAFGSSWGHDAAELDDIRHATPMHRARYRYDHGSLHAREMRGFAIAGASSEHGYLQRLSVDPAVQRQGDGRALTIDALGWMTFQRMPDCLVNTSVDNVPALALYESVGFVPMRDHLSVMQLDVNQAA
jgi:ribosomal protein S18 acetylase RimI-like enzyme